LYIISASGFAARIIDMSQRGSRKSTKQGNCSFAALGET